MSDRLERGFPCKETNKKKKHPTCVGSKYMTRDVWFNEKACTHHTGRKVLIGGVTARQQGLFNSKSAIWTL